MTNFSSIYMFSLGTVEQSRNLPELENKMQAPKFERGTKNRKNELENEGQNNMKTKHPKQKQ